MTSSCWQDLYTTKFFFGILHGIRRLDYFMRSVSVMEWNLNTPSEWDWENLSMYSGRAIESPRHEQLFSNETEGNVVVDNGSIYSSGSDSFSGSALGHGSLYPSLISASVDSSSLERTKTFGDIDEFPKDSCEKEDFSWVAKIGSFPNMAEASVVSSEPMIGLKLGRQSYCKTMCSPSTTQTTSFSVRPPSSSSPIKRSRACYQSTQSPCCQVEGCNLNLASAKDYHRRHRICESHSKSPKVVVAGMERRFCQQCSRFHGLSEFDDKKRSCRRRLSDHNARRRRPLTEDIQFSSTRFSSLIYDRRSEMNFLVNRFPIPVPNPTWESGNFKVTLSGESLFSLAKGGGIHKKPHLSGDLMPNAISTLDLDSDRNPFQGNTPRVHNHGLQESTVISYPLVVPEVRHAFSLLSTSSLGLNEPESTSLDRFVHENNISLAQPGMPTEMQNWELPPSDYVRVEQPSSQHRDHKMDLQNFSISQFQEVHSFAPHESQCFYSNQIN